MTPAEIYRDALRRGFWLQADGNNLLVCGKRQISVPSDFADTLRQHKGELLVWLSHPPCPGWGAVPPADLPLNPAMPCPPPLDRERVIAYMLRQGCDRPGQLTAWLVRRENAYYEGPGRHWDCSLLAYAAARDAACWQLTRCERDVLALIQGRDEFTRR